MDETDIKPDFAVDDLLTRIRQRLEAEVDDVDIGEDDLPLDPEGAYTTKELAKRLGVGRRKIREVLHEMVIVEKVAEKTTKTTRTIGPTDTMDVTAYKLKEGQTWQLE